VILTFDEKVDNYNDSVDEEYQIYNMYELNDVLIDYGYDEYELDDLYSLDEIDSRYFDTNDDYFWKASNGYYYSGDKSDVLDMIGDETDAENGNTFYRYVVNIDGTDYGFIRAIDVLIKNDVLKANSKDVQKINSILTNMTVPELRRFKDNSKCYFTEKGKQHYNGVIKKISDIISKYGYEVEEQSKELDNYDQVDDYQVIAKYLYRKREKH
jgi:hypothetical protein